MAISAGSDILASDVIAASTGASDAGKLGKTDSNGKFDNSFLYDSVRQRYQFTAGAAISAAGIPLHLSPYCQANGAILLDNQSLTRYAATTNQSKSFTVSSNSNRLLLVHVVAASAPSGVTYNAVSMTLVDSQATNGGYVEYVYKLIAPATGTNNITVTGTSIEFIGGICLYNVDQTTPVEASAKAGASGGSASVNLTTLTSGAMVATFGSQSASGGGLSGTPAITASSKYSKDATNTNVTSNGIGQIGASMGITTIINEAQTIGNTISFSSGSGTVDSAIISVSVKPASSMSSGVIPASSAAIVHNAPLIDFVGWSESSASIGGSVYAIFGGGVSGLTGLTAGLPIYLQDTAGTYGHTRGAYGKIIGRAVSSTEAVIRPEKTAGAPIAKITAYQYTAECDGFLIVGGVSATATIVTDGNTLNITGTATNGGTVTFPVSRGKTYTITGTTNLYFIPFA